MKLRIDSEFKELIHPLTEDEYLSLEESIKKNGCLAPVTVWGETVIDGHNRYAICSKHSVSFDIKEIDFENMHPKKENEKRATHKEKKAKERKPP